jgi:hypothetical protein
VQDGEQSGGESGSETDELPTKLHAGAPIGRVHAAVAGRVAPGVVAAGALTATQGATAGNDPRPLQHDASAGKSNPGHLLDSSMTMQRDLIPPAIAAHSLPERATTQTGAGPCAVAGGPAAPARHRGSKKGGTAAGVMPVHTGVVLPAKPAARHHYGGSSVSHLRAASTLAVGLRVPEPVVPVMPDQAQAQKPLASTGKAPHRNRSVNMVQAGLRGTASASGRKGADKDKQSEDGLDMSPGPTSSFFH